MMVIGYEATEELSLITVFACGALQMVAFSGVMVWAHLKEQQAMNAWLDSKVKELDERSHRPYNNVIQIEAYCNQCHTIHTRMPLFAKYEDKVFSFPCEHKGCKNVLQVPLFNTHLLDRKDVA